MQTRLRRLTTLVRQVWTFVMLEPVTWLDGDNIAACRYPSTDQALVELADRGVRLLINLHQQPHRPEQIARHGMNELHLPVADFTPPTPEQLERGVAAMESAIGSGTRVAVHCGAGLGRTGTLLACYLVRTGLRPEEAIGRIRAQRPGSIETPAQEAAVRAFGAIPG